MLRCMCVCVCMSILLSIFIGLSINPIGLLLCDCLTYYACIGVCVCVGAQIKRIQFFFIFCFFFGKILILWQI